MVRRKGKSRTGTITSPSLQGLFLHGRPRDGLVVIVVGHLVGLLVVALPGQVPPVRPPRLARGLVRRLRDAPRPHVARGPVPARLRVGGPFLPLLSRKGTVTGRSQGFGAPVSAPGSLSVGDKGGQSKTNKAFVQVMSLDRPKEADRQRSVEHS